VITLTLPWWCFLVYGFVLVELGRFAAWMGDAAGRAGARWMRNRRVGHRCHAASLRRETELAVLCSAHGEDVNDGTRWTRGWVTAW
jgi:hypothetical protein